MMMNPKLAIIVATYNSYNDLNKLLKSIELFKSLKIELIIIDNKSSDKSHLLFKKYENIISKIIIEKDQGIYDAWNKGIKIANSDWICFVGADDIIFEQELIKMVDIANSNEHLNFISGNIKVGNQTIGKPFNKNEIKKYQRFIHVGSITNKKFLIDNYCFDINFKIAGDYDFYLKNRNKIIYYYHNSTIGLMGEDGVSNKNKLVIKESFLSRKKNNINIFLNIYSTIRHIISFYR